VLVKLSELLSNAASSASAVGAFTAYNLETAVAVLDAAGRREAGVMLLVSEHAFRSRSGSALARTLTAVAAQAPVPCCVQLDHVTSLETIEAAFEAGIGAVMADGSRLSVKENAEFVGAAVRVAQRFGGGVEAELGRIEGDEEIASAAASGKLTEPLQAAAFLESTGASCLAVSIGNAHGRYVHPPQLDLERLERVHAATPVPLSLHGASGLPDEQVLTSVARGIRKVNVNTELRDRYFALLAQRLAEFSGGARVLALQEELIDALAAVVDAKLNLFAPPNAAHPIPAT
jgi:fructose-bisphosphate aldolase, class II